MKSELVLKAELEARDACDDLGWTEEEIQNFIEWHVSKELERDADRARDLGKPKRNADLTNAIINIAIAPFQENPLDSFPSIRRSSYKSDEQMMADNHEHKRNRFET